MPPPSSFNRTTKRKPRKRRTPVVGPQNQGAAPQPTQRTRAQARREARAQVAASLAALERDRGSQITGPRSSGSVTPRQARIAGTTARFTEGRVPLAQRTADTPWQEANRPVRRKQRKAKQEAARQVRALLAELSPIQPPARGARRSGIRVGQTFEGQARVGVGRDLSPGKDGGIGDFFTEDIPGAFESAGAGVEDFVGGLISPFLPGEGKRGTPQGELGAEVQEGAVTVGSWLPKIPVQIAEGFAYTPAFVYGIATNPVGTARGMIDYFKYAVEDPARFVLERPGDVLMIAVGGKGLLSGRVPNVVKAAARGDARGAARAAVTPARSTGALQSGVPIVKDFTLAKVSSGTRGRERGRENELMAKIESAEPATLVKIADRLVVDRPRNVPVRQMRIAQSEAIRSVMEQTTPRERMQFYENAVVGLNAKPITANRLKKLITANQIVETLRFVEGEPGSIRISEGQGRLAALTDRVIASSKQGQERKLTLGLLDPAQAAIRIDQPGAFIRGQDRIAGERIHLALPEFPGDESMRPSLATVRSLESDLARAQGRLATLQAKESTPALDRKIADEQRIIQEISERISEAEQYLPQPERLTPGLAYSPYKSEDLAPRMVLPPRIRQKLGMPQKPSSHAFTGESLKRGNVENVVKLTAQEEITTLRYQQRLRAWKEAKLNAIPASELIRRVDAGEIPDLGEWAAVRLKAGTSTLPTKKILDLFHMYEIDNARRLLDVIGERMPAIDDLRAIAEAADNERQVGFFKVEDVGLKPLEMKRRGVALTTARAINQLAKTSVLFLAGPAYAFPNMLGQLAFSIIHKGMMQPLNDFWVAPRTLNKLGQETRLRVRAAGDAGMVLAFNPAVGPIQMLRKANRVMADFYSRFLDDWWRERAFIYEARLLGYKTPEEITRLVNATDRKDPEYKDLLEANRGVNEHFGAFNRLTDPEKNAITELIFFYPWLRASAVYAAKLPLNHPVKAAVLQLGGTYSEAKATEDFIQLFMGHGATRQHAELAAAKLMDTIPGIFLTEDGRKINPQAASLISSPLEAMNLLGPLTSGDWDAFTQNLLDSTTPAVSLGAAAIEGAIDRNADPALQRLQENVQGYNRDVTLGRRMSGDQGSWFTYTPGEAIGARVLGSGFPSGVNAENILEQSWDEYLDGLPPARRTYVRAAEVRQKWLDLAKKNGLLDNGDRNPEELREAFNRGAQLAAAKAEARDRLGDSAREDSGAYTIDAYRVMAREELKSMRKWGLMTDSEYRAAVRKLPSLSRADLIDAHEYEARHGRLWDAYGQTFSDYRNSLKEAGVDESMIPDPVR